MSQEITELEMSSEQIRVVSILAEHTGNHSMGIAEDELCKTANMSHSKLLGYLFKIQERELLIDKILQVGTGGTRNRFYKLTKDAVFAATLKKLPKTE